MLTALVIAGGSSGVNKMLQALGFRSVQEGPPPVTNPPPTVAWLAVVLRRSHAVGTVKVLAGDEKNPKPVGKINGLALAGRIRRFFLKDDARFPPSGGHTLTPGNYEVRLEGFDKTGNKTVSQTWGPYNIQAGSIVDVELTL